MRQELKVTNSLMVNGTTYDFDNLPIDVGEEVGKRLAVNFFEGAGYKPVTAVEYQDVNELKNALKQCKEKSSEEAATSIGA